MSSRALRRLQRAQERELLVPEEEEDTSATIIQKPFEALAIEEGPVDNGDEPVAVVASPVRERAKRRPRRRAKDKKEEIQEAPAVEVKQPVQQNWHVYPKYFDVNAELTRIFGSMAHQDQSATGAYKKSGKGAIHSFLVPHLIRANPGWTGQQPGTRGGVASIKMVRKEDGEYVFCYDAAYQQAEIEFIQAVESFDPEAIQQLVLQHPHPHGHIHAILALSDIYRHQGDYTQASECVERALVVLERAFHPLFKPLEHAISYDGWYENRPLFLALFRHIDLVGRKGCWRSSMEFCKLLYHLDRSDPIGVVWMIDFYSLQARQYEFLVSDAFEQIMASSCSLCHFPPQFYFSRAVAYWNMYLAQKTEDFLALAREYMQTGAQLYPNVLLWLCNEKNIMSSDIQVEEIDDPYWMLLQRLYVERCSSIWKQPQNVQWLEKFMKGAGSQYEARGSNCQNKQVHCRRLYRHVYLLDDPNVRLPADASDGKTTGLPKGRHPLQRHDPFPHPLTKINIDEDQLKRGEFCPEYVAYFQELQELYLLHRNDGLLGRLARMFG
jgi:tetratricopeptide (TPR) repeat protein